MTVRLIFLATSLMLGLPALAADHTRPSDIKVAPLSADVPAHCAEFYSETGWGKAIWDSGRYGELWVESISSDCTAQVVYVFGPRGQQPGGYLRVSDAKIKGKYLTFVLDLEYLGQRVVADVRYESAKAYSDKRPLLMGRWAGRSGGSTTYITLEKGAL